MSLDAAFSFFLYSLGTAVYVGVLIWIGYTIKDWRKSND